MIAAERSSAATAPTAAATAPGAGSRIWSGRLPAVVLVIAIVASLGGGGMLDVGNAFTVEGRAQALVERWVYMVDNGIPESDLAPVRHEWTQAQASKLLGVAWAFWLPGGADTVSRWEAATEAVWARDLSRYRSDALAAEQLLHDALAPEQRVLRKARLDALAESTTPLDYATLRDEWIVEARLVPVDRRVAASVSSLSGQTAQARSLGIRSDPAADVLARAGAYAQLMPIDRMARAE